MARVNSLILTPIKRVKGEQKFFYIINKFASESVFLLSALKAAAKW